MKIENCVKTCGIKEIRQEFAKLPIVRLHYVIIFLNGELPSLHIFPKNKLALIISPSVCILTIS